MKRFFVQYRHRTDWPRREPSPTRARVLAFVKSELAEGRPWPSTTVIARHMGWSGHSVALDALNCLKLDGHVRRLGHSDGRSPVWELVE